MSNKNKNLTFSPLSARLCQTKREWESEQKESYEKLSKDLCPDRCVARGHTA